MYAIVKAGGRQEKVAVGDVIELDRVQSGAGESVSLPALMLVDGESITTGADAAKASVTAEVLEHMRGPKIIILRYRNKTGYRRRQGHRQDLTRVRVTGIETGK